MQKRKMVVWGGLTIADKRREAKGKGEKIYSSECTVPKNTKERLKKKKKTKKNLPQWSMQRNRGKQ